MGDGSEILSQAPVEILYMKPGCNWDGDGDSWDGDGDSWDGDSILYIIYTHSANG